MGHKDHVRIWRELITAGKKVEKERLTKETS